MDHLSLGELCSREKLDKKSKNVTISPLIHRDVYKIKSAPLSADNFIYS